MSPNLAIARSPEKVPFVGKGDISSTTVGFEFEFICPSSQWRNLPRLVSDKLGPVGEISKAYGSHHSRKDALTKWHITGDSSISGYPLGSSFGKEPDQMEGESDEDYGARLDEAVGHVGVELVSPILSAADTDKVLRSAFEVIEAVSGYTNASCGLHITLGNSKISTHLDPIKFAVFLGDRKILARYGRLANTHAESLLDYAESILRNPEDYYPEAEDADDDYSYSDDNDDDCFDDSDFEREAREVPFEHMRKELLRSSVCGRGYISHDRAEVLMAISKMSSDNKEDRYMSVNLTKVASNVIEYRAIGGDYLSSLGAIQHIAKRAVHSLLVATGQIDSPEIEKAYARYLVKTFASVVSRAGAETAQAGHTKKQFTFQGSVDVFPDDINSNLMLQVTSTATDASKSDPSVGLAVAIRLVAESTTIASINVGFTVTSTKGEWVPSRKDMLYRVTQRTKSTTGELTAAQISGSLKAIRAIALKPTHAIWRDAEMALVTILRGHGLSLDSSLAGMRYLRNSLFSTFSFNELSPVAAELVAKWMNSTDLDARYGKTKNSHVQAVRAELDNVAYTNAWSTAVYGVPHVMYMGDYQKALIEYKIRNPLDNSPKTRPVDRKLKTIDDSGIGFCIEGVFSLLACGYILSVEQFVQEFVSAMSEFDFYDALSKSNRFTPQQAALNIVATVASYIYKCSVSRSKYLPNTASVEAGAYEFASATGRATPEFTAQLSSIFKAARSVSERVYARDGYRMLWDTIIPALHNTELRSILRGIDVHSNEYNLLVDTGFPAHDPITASWNAEVSSLLNK